MKKPAKHPECPDCHCGLILVEWSDRQGYIDPTDPEDMVEGVLDCALDHSYDRTSSGIPYNYPEDVVKKLTPVLSAWFLEHHPEWGEFTVSLNEEERQQLKDYLLNILKGELG
jgi:hypothetical protein